MKTASHNADTRRGRTRTWTSSGQVFKSLFVSRKQVSQPGYSVLGRKCAGVSTPGRNRNSVRALISADPTPCDTSYKYTWPPAARRTGHAVSHRAVVSVERVEKAQPMSDLVDHRHVQLHYTIIQWSSFRRLPGPGSNWAFDACMPSRVTTPCLCH